MRSPLVHCTSEISTCYSVQFALVSISLTTSALLFATPIVPPLGQWAFALHQWLLFITFPGLFTILPVAVQHVWGFKYFDSNYGLIVVSYVCLFLLKLTMILLIRMSTEFRFDEHFSVMFR